MKNNRLLTAANRLRAFNWTTYAVTVVLLIASSSTWSQNTPQLIPARFTNTTGSFGSLLKMPPNVDNNDKVVGIACQTIVEPTGRAKNVNCFNELLSERHYVQVILDAGSDGTISPALANRIPVRVLMNFSVLFICKDEKCNVFPLPHHNRYSEAYGLDYFAPQVLLPDNNWYPGFDEKMALIEAREGTMYTNDRLASDLVDFETSSPDFFRSRSTAEKNRDLNANIAAYIVNIDIDVQGQAIDSEVSFTLFRYLQEQARDVESSISDISFVPGYARGEPVEMGFQEYGVVDPALIQSRRQNDVYDELRDLQDTPTQRIQRE